MTQPVVAFIKNLSHVYGEKMERRYVLKKVSMVLQKGEVVILSGPSGSGKTTLLTIMGGLRDAQSGMAMVMKHNLVKADDEGKRLVRQKIGYIFQQHNLFGFLTARQNVELTLEMVGILNGRIRRAMACDALEAVGMWEFANYYPHQLSVGQKQRVAIARAIVHEPDLILADEPTASLDKVSGLQVIQLLRRLAKEKGKTVFIVSHDNRIFDFADRLLLIDDGELQETGVVSGDLVMA